MITEQTMMRMTPSKVELKPGIVMLSGGCDSTITLAYLLDKGVTVFPLVISNDSKFFKEKTMRFIKMVSEHYKIEFKLKLLKSVNFEELVMDTKKLGADEDYIPGYQTFIYFPAMAYADKIGVEAIYTGFNRDTCFGSGAGILFPGRKVNDDTVWAVVRMQDLYNKLYDTNIQVVHPFRNMTKAEQLKIGAELNVPFEKTCSCGELEPNEEDLFHCGMCRTCGFRRRAFTQAELVDPVKYKV